MALIYTKLTDKTTVLAPRQGGGRKFNFGSDWTEVRVGMFATAIAATGSNDDNVVESLVPSGITDHVTFGIKDNSATYPGQVGSLFLGIRSHDVPDCVSVAGSGIGDQSGSWRPVGYYGTTEVIGAATGAARIGWGTASAGSNYASFFAIKIVITDRGLSTQSVTMSISASAAAVSAYTATDLRTALNNATYTAMASIAWNDGAAARDIPDCYWVRTPLFLNSLRISCIRAIRYAP